MPRIKAANLRQHHEQTWQQLLDALEELLVEREYDAITLTEIAGRAGIARNTVYNYAPDKITLLARAAERAGRGAAERIALIAATDAPATERLQALVGELVGSFAHGAIRFALLQDVSGRSEREPAGEAQEWASPYASIIENVRGVVRAGIDTGEFRRLDDVDLTVSLMAGLVSAGVERAAVLEPAERPSIADAVGDLLLRGLRVP